jgi:hypothetical protein
MTHINFHALLPCYTCLQRLLDGLKHVRVAWRVTVRDVKMTSRCKYDDELRIYGVEKGSRPNNFPPLTSKMKRQNHRCGFA